MNDIILDLGPWANGINIWSTLFKMGLAVIFSAIVGLERARKRHAAGLRTFMLVSIGAVVAGIADRFVMEQFSVAIPVISAALVIGIATISCNAILFSSKNQLKGLTTSVCLWVFGVISVALGLGMYTVFLIGAITLILTLMLFLSLEKKFKERSAHFEIHLELKARNLLHEFTEAVRKFGLSVNDVEINPAYANSGLGVYSVIMTIEDEKLKKKAHGEIIEALASLDCVYYIEEID